MIFSDWWMDEFSSICVAGCVNCPDVSWFVLACDLKNSFDEMDQKVKWVWRC